MPASLQNICFMFCSSFNLEQCWMLSNCLFLWVRQVPKLVFIPNSITLLGKSESTTKASNCWDSVCFERVPMQSLPLSFLLEQWDKKEKMKLTFLNWKAMMICDHISPPAQWTNHILKFILEISNQENQVIKSEQRLTYASLSNLCQGKIFQIMTTVSADRIKQPHLDVSQI